MLIFQLTVQEWLRFLNLEDYYNNLTADGYTTMEGVMNMAWEDLEEIGIHKLGNCFYRCRGMKTSTN